MFFSLLVCNVSTFCDFSENYSCKNSSEIQAVRFGSSHQQATLHTGVLSIGGEKEPILALCHSQDTKAPSYMGTLESGAGLYVSHIPSTVHISCAQYK